MTQAERTSTPTSAPVAKLQLIGAGLIILSTIAIAIVPSLAKLAYEGGSNTLSVITGRSVFSVAITFLLVTVMRQPLAIARRPLLISLSMGAGYAVILYGYLGAVNYLPVNLVILIYFIHPLLVGLIVMMVGQERLTLISIGALCLAVVGLGFALGFSFGDLNLTGVALATVSMVVTAIVIVGNSRALREAPALSIGFYMMLSAAVVLAVLFFMFGTLGLPTTRLAWAGFLGVAVAATGGTLAFMCGMAYVGAARAAMISNLEPVIGVLFALAVLGERVTLLQGAGIIMVIVAIFLMEWRR